jgi:hypothetical protein
VDRFFIAEISGWAGVIRVGLTMCADAACSSDTPVRAIVVFRAGLAGIIILQWPLIIDRIFRLVRRVRAWWAKLGHGGFWGADFVVCALVSCRFRNNESVRRACQVSVVALETFLALLSARRGGVCR